jgi:hypothetical protein
MSRGVFPFVPGTIAPLVIYKNLRCNPQQAG